MCCYFPFLELPSSHLSGFTGTNARPSIAPTFGVQPCMGTNPLTFGVPTSDPFPFVIDCATSINQRSLTSFTTKYGVLFNESITIRGKIEKYERLGMDTPKGCVIDSDGNERTDTSVSEFDRNGVTLISTTYF